MLVWMPVVSLPLGVLVIVLGVVAFRTGWVIRPARGHVTRPRVYGVGAVLMGVGVLVMGAVYLAVRLGALASPPWGVLYGNALIVAGALFVAAGHLFPARGRAPHPTGPLVRAGRSGQRR